MNDVQYAEYLERKKATRIDFTVKKKDGKILNPEVVSLTVQDKRDSSDINRIMKRFNDANAKGELFIPPGLKDGGMYTDLTNAPEHEECLNRVIRMNEMFMMLPGEVRARYDNDPIKLVEELDKSLVDPKVKEELQLLGVLPKSKKEVKKIDLPDGQFWVFYKDGVEYHRKPVVPITPVITP